jgi:hypothetical protein
MHNRDVHISYAGFYGLGRTDKSLAINDPVVDANWNLVEGTGTNPRGRYAMHFHRNGATESGMPATVTGSVVDDSVGWGFVNHSSFVNIVESVAHDVVGSGFVTEAGDEVGQFLNNIAIHLPGVGTQLDTTLRSYIGDFGHGGEGFWLQGPGVAVSGNVVAGSAGGAFTYFLRGLREFGYETEFATENLVDPSIAEGANSVPLRDVAPRPFTGNTAYASSVGLQTRYVLYQSTNDQEAVFSDSLFWNNATGIFAPYTHNSTFERITIYHDSSSLPHLGFSSTGVTRDITFRHIVVSGYKYGIWVTWQGYTKIESGVLANGQNVRVTEATSDDREYSVGLGVTLLSYPWDMS